MVVEIRKFARIKACNSTLWVVNMRDNDFILGLRLQNVLFGRGVISVTTFIIIVKRLMNVCLMKKARFVVILREHFGE